MPEQFFVLGVDGGGTKTIAVIADQNGMVKGIGRSGGTNFQGVGIPYARENLYKAIEEALANAKCDRNSIQFACYGIAGADRDVDFETIHSYIKPVNPAKDYILVNDTTIALRAGTKDGVGVAIIAGTGSNCIGFNREGKQAKVGGMGRFTGDHGSGNDIVEKAIIASMRGYDGRGYKTSLYRKLADALNLKELEDIVEFTFFGNFNPPEIGALAPLVFQAANEGDRVAINILKQTGKELANCANAAIRRLFKKDEKVVLVLGGSILQKAQNPTLIDTLIRYVKRQHPLVEVVKLDIEPVLGALFFCYDRLKIPMDDNFISRVKNSFNKIYTGNN